MDVIGFCFLEYLQQCLWVKKKDGKLLFSKRERYAFSKAYGLEDGSTSRLEVIAGELNLSRERVRQLKMKVFKRISYLRHRKYSGCIIG